MASSFSGGGSRSSRREPPTMGKQLLNFITCGCESSAGCHMKVKLSNNIDRIKLSYIRSTKFDYIKLLYHKSKQLLVIHIYCSLISDSSAKSTD